MFNPSNASTSTPISCSTLIVNPSEDSAPRFGLALINVETCLEGQSAGDTPVAAQAL